MADQAYRPADQDEKLGPPPWKPDDPAVIAWERHHGHDPRLHCYLDGCGVLQLIAEAEHDELEALREEVRRLGLHTDADGKVLGTGEPMWQDVAGFPRIAALLRSDGTQPKE